MSWDQTRISCTGRWIFYHWATREARTTSHWWVSTNNKCWRGHWERRILLHSFWECKAVQPLWKPIESFLRKLRIELSYDPAIPLLGTNPDQTLIQKDTCTPMFIAALFTIAKIWKQLKCPPADEWIKMWYMYTMEQYSAIKKNKILPFAATWMQLEITMLSEVSQKKKDKYHMIPLIGGIQNTAQMNLVTK